MSQINNNITPNKGSFIRPVINNCGTNKTENLVEKVTDILKNDPNALKPDDPIYSAALSQYNKGIRAATTDRMPIPAGFCGIQDPSKGILRVEPLIAPIVRIDPLPIPVNTPISQGPGYPEDKCLQFGEPGSIEYNICGGRISDPANLQEATIPRKNVTPSFWIGILGSNSGGDPVDPDSIVKRLEIGPQGDGTERNFSGILSHTPIRTGTVIIDFYGGRSSRERFDDGDHRGSIGKLVSGSGATGTINYLTGAWSITCVEGRVPSSGENIIIRYSA